jgi:flagellar hook-length control protein FliK
MSTAATSPITIASALDLVPAAPPPRATHGEPRFQSLLAPAKPQPDRKVAEDVPRELPAPERDPQAADSTESSDIAPTSRESDGSERVKPPAAAESSEAVEPAEESRTVENDPTSSTSAIAESLAAVAGVALPTAVDPPGERRQETIVEVFVVKPGTTGKPSAPEGLPWNAPNPEVAKAVDPASPPAAAEVTTPIAIAETALPAIAATTPVIEQVVATPTTTPVRKAKTETKLAVEVKSSEDHPELVQRIADGAPATGPIAAAALPAEETDIAPLEVNAPASDASKEAPDPAIATDAAVDDASKQAALAPPVAAEPASRLVIDPPPAMTMAPSVAPASADVAAMANRPHLPPEILVQAPAERGLAGPAIDVDSARLLHRVARAVATVHEQGGEIRLRLSPPELGALRLEVRVQDGAMVARMETETSAARSAILDNLPALRERLAEQNVRIERFDVDLMQRQGSGTPDQPSDGHREPLPQRPTPTVPRPRTDKPTTAEVPAAASRASGRLNVIV